MSSSKNITTLENESKPKRELNPILKSMNDYRNNVIGAHIGTKAPKKTAPIFKLTLDLARTQLGIDKNLKNTIEIVDKASEIFSTNPEKFTQLAIAAQEAEAAIITTTTTTVATTIVEAKPKGKSKQTKSKDEVVEATVAEPKSKGKSKKASAKEESIEIDVVETKTAKGKSKKAPAKEESIEIDVVETKTTKRKSKKAATTNSDAIEEKIKIPIIKKKTISKKLPIKQEIDSDSDDSDSD